MHKCCKFACWRAVPQKAAGDARAYDKVETEPGLDKFIDDPVGQSFLKYM